MSLNREEKAVVIEEVTAELAKAQSIIIAEYRGLDVASASVLRKKARESGVYLGEGLARLAYRYDHGQLRGHGLMWGLTLSDDSADAVVNAALHEGLILNAPQPNCLRFTPALTVSKSNIDEMLLRLARAFSRVRTAQLQCRKGIAV